MNKKKANMMYWDGIDTLSERYVERLMAFSQNIPIYADEFEEKFDESQEDVVLELGKEITEFATKLLEERLGAEFPYVDENY